MYITMLKSKIHRATVTGCNLNYEGSILIDSFLLKKAMILPFEKVDIYNISNGKRFSTYVNEEKEFSGIICLNGAAARKASIGDLIIIASYVMIDPKDTVIKPGVVYVNNMNSFKSISILS